MMRYEYLEPGIRKTIEDMGCVYTYDGGFVPLIVKDHSSLNEKKVEISIQRCLYFAEKNMYKEITQYIGSLVHPKILVP